MTKKAARRKQINKDTKAQKRRKKRLQHYGVAPVTISKHWNRQKTLEQNYAILGLSTDANKAVSQEAEERVGVLTEELNEIANMPKAPVYVVKSMSLKEQRLIKDLMRKYGEDVEAMGRDFKINVHQWTSGQLSKRIELYKRLLNL